MMKTEIVPWDALFAANESTVIPVAQRSLAPVPNDDGFNPERVSDIWPEVLQAADWLALGILVVVGGLWMFGNRTPAIKRLIDMAIGYEIIRHAPAILKWLSKF